jgi:hypothetical protein
MKIFIVEHTPSGDVYRSYEGMDADTVAALVKEHGNPFEEISGDVYNKQVAVLGAALEEEMKARRAAS